VNLSGSKSRVAGVAKDISLKWTETKNHWHDARSAEFDQRYMQEFFLGVEKTVTIIEKLDEILRKVQHDCE
jgi:predicted ATPase